MGSKTPRYLWPNTGLAASGAISAQRYTLAASHPTMYLPYKIQKEQDTLYPSMGLRHPATFAKIPTCAPPERRGVWTMTMVVLAVANVV